MSSRCVAAWKYIEMALFALISQKMCTHFYFGVSMEDLFLTWEAPVELGGVFWSSPQISCTLGIAGHADAALFLKHPWRHLGW